MSKSVPDPHSCDYLFFCYYCHHCYRDYHSILYHISSYIIILLDMHLSFGCKHVINCSHISSIPRIIHHVKPNPICSIYDIFTNINQNSAPNIGKYSIHGPYGNCLLIFPRLVRWESLQLFDAAAPAFAHPASRPVPVQQDAIEANPVDKAKIYQTCLNTTAFPLTFTSLHFVKD